MKNISSILLALLFLFSFEINGQVPIATFTATPNPVCACSNISFTNSSTNTPTTWTWYFPGGTPSFTTVTTAPGNPGLIIYCTPGFYTISLVVSNSSGSDSVTNTLTVDSLPIITIDPSSGGICDVAGGNAFDTIYFTARASSNSTFSWAPPAGLSCINCSNPRAYPIATTVYTITATSVSGCISTETDTVYADSIVASIRGTDTICPGQPDTLLASGGANNVSTPTTYAWSNGQTSSEIIVSPTTTTTYTCTITSGTEDCQSTASFTVDTLCFITGVKSIATQMGLIIIPNPATSLLSVVLVSPLNNLSSLTITDITGREIYFQTLNPNQKRYDVSISTLSKGMYFIQLKTQGTIMINKFIKD